MRLPVTSRDHSRRRFLRFLAETFIEASHLAPSQANSGAFLRFLAETFIEARVWLGGLSATRRISSLSSGDLH